MITLINNMYMLFIITIWKCSAYLCCEDKKIDHVIIYVFSSLINQIKLYWSIVEWYLISKQCMIGTWREHLLVKPSTVPPCGAPWNNQCMIGTWREHLLVKPITVPPCGAPWILDALQPRLNCAGSQSILEP